MSKTKTARNQHKIAHRHRNAIVKRIKYTRSKPERIIRPPVQVSDEIGGNSFLNVTLETIPAMEIDNRSGINAETLVNLFRNHVAELVSDIEGEPNAKILLKMAQRMDELAKQIIGDSEGGWFIGQVNEAPALIFYQHLPELSGWIPLRINYLSALKRRSKNWHNTVLQSYRHFTKNLLFAPLTDVHYCLDYVIERFEEENEEDDEDELKAKRRVERLVDSYLNGKVHNAFNEIVQDPELTIDECIAGLKRFPKDLQPLAEAIANGLSVARTGQSMLDYDLRFGAGINEVDAMEEYYISIDRQFNWVYDFDYIFDMAGEGLDADYSSSGQQPPCCWTIFAPGFKAPSSVESFINDTKKSFDGSFVEDFDKSMVAICHTVNKLFPSKYN